MTPNVRSVKLQELAPAKESGAVLFPPKIDLIQGVKVRLAAAVGEAEITVADLFALKEGSIVTLDKSTEDAVELFLDGKLVGLGELVVVGDHFGVRLTQIGTASTA